MHASNPAAMAGGKVATRVLILSDTHGMKNLPMSSDIIFDLAIHCGDLTQESKIEEFHSTLELLRKVPAHTKVVIAGNHDITLEEDTFRKHLSSAGLRTTDSAVVKEYGQPGEARALLEAAWDERIYFLDEGIHTLALLSNDTKVSIYVNPETPRRNSEGALGSAEAGWAYQYDSTSSSEDRFSSEYADIFVTHGPPEGVLDYVNRERAGCPDLFAAVARAKPQLHCFGHIHAGWGAKVVTWRNTNEDKPSHFTAIDNNASAGLERLSDLKPGRFDTDDLKEAKRTRAEKMLAVGYAELDVGEARMEPGRESMFVNAAIEGDDVMPIHPAIAVTLALPRTRARSLREALEV